MIDSIVHQIWTIENYRIFHSVLLKNSLMAFRIESDRYVVIPITMYYSFYKEQPKYYLQ